MINGKDFRNIIGPNDIRSNSYEIVMEGYYVDFYGRGWGHGVGLCQWGAYGMAQKSFDYKAILSHYYPGSKLVSIDELDLKF
jgi:stage II sporulation protein D